MGGERARVRGRVGEKYTVGRRKRGREGEMEESEETVKERDP